jgi:hypothetical protein
MGRNAYHSHVVLSAENGFFLAAIGNVLSKTSDSGAVSFAVTLF